jgi:DNA replication protein DnaC
MTDLEPTPISAFLGIDSTIKKETCKSHGDYDSRNIFRQVWSSCPTCSADQQAIRQREEVARAATEKARVWQRRLGEAGIPERFHSRTIDSYNATNAGQKSALTFAMEYAEGFEVAQKAGRSAIFCGKPGTGKTHLAVGIGLHAMTLGKLVLFTTVQRAVRRVKDSWRKDSQESETDVIDMLVEPDLLILDEIGVQFGSEFEKNLMFDILNERYEKSRPSLLISNLTATEVKAFLGERVYDRLREDGGKCIPFDWASHRGKND